MLDLPNPSLEFQLWYATALISAVGYAIVLMTLLFSLRLLWRVRREPATLGRRALLPYAVLSLVFSTTLFVLEAQGLQSALRVTANGNSFEGLTPGHTDAAELAVDIVYHTTVLMNDAFLVYRMLAIVQQKITFLVVPTLLFSTSMVSAIVADVSSASTLGRPSTQLTETATLVWLLASVLFNVVVTTAIVFVVWPARRADSPVGRRATSVISILAESAASYTAVGILFIVAIVTGSDLQILLERAFGVTAFISSSAITLRIALGIEYTPGSNPPSTLPTTDARWSNRTIGDKEAAIGT